MTFPDYLVLAIYFLLLSSIGYICMRRVKGQEDFFLGGRGFGKREVAVPEDGRQQVVKVVRNTPRQKPQAFQLPCLLHLRFERQLLRFRALAFRDVHGHRENRGHFASRVVDRPRRQECGE